MLLIPQGKWWKGKYQQAFQDEQEKFRKAKQDFRDKRESHYQGSSTHGGVEGDIPGKILNFLPTPAVFNAKFDKALSKLPDGVDLMRKTSRWCWPYLQLSRVDKPIGSWLLFLPSAWGICMAAPSFGLPNIPLLALFGVGK